MFELIVEKVPELKRLEQVVADLERENAEAQARVQALALKVQQTREDDLNREAAALNSGREVPKPKEPQLREQLEGAQRDLEVLERRLTLAGTDRARYLSEHHAEIAGLLEEAHDAEGERVAAAASEALAALLRRFQAEDDARNLARLHPAPAPENTGEAESVATVWGHVNTRSVTGGPQRGTLEQTLRYLVSLGAPTIVEGVEEGDAEDAA
jgi:hypothetical protein